MKAQGSIAQLGECLGDNQEVMGSSPVASISGREGLSSVSAFFMGFSLLKGMEFFAFRKMEYPETINHPLGGWETIGYAKITFPNTIKLFRLYCRKER